MRCCGPILGGLTTAVALALAAPATVRGAGPAIDAPITIHLEPYAGRLRQIRVEAGRPLPPFLFDTGGGGTFVTPAVAESLGCAPHGRMTAFRHNGDRLDLSECGPLPLTIGDWHGRPSVAIFDLTALLPRELPELGGVLSLHTFRDQRLTVDLANDRIVIESDTSFAARIEGMRPLRTRLSTEAGGEGLDLFVEVEARQGALWLLVDSGNLAEVLLAPHALRQLGHDAWAEAAEGGADSLGSREIGLQFPGVGSFDVAARAVPGIIYDGLLNADLLRRWILTIDLADGRSWVRLAE